MNFARLVLSSSAAAVRSSFLKQKISAPTFRSFAAVLKDLDYKVDSNVDADFGAVKIPYLRDETRQEMYKLYMEDPTEQAFLDISKKYGTSLIRTKAVIVLMSKRHTMISEDEAKLHALVNGGKEPEVVESAEGSVQTWKIAPAFNAPQVLKDLHVKHVEDQTVPLGLLISSYNEQFTEEQESQKLTMSEEDLRQAFRIMSRHAMRQQNFQEWLGDVDFSLEECEEWGVDHTFRESPSEFNTNKAYNYTHHRSWHKFQSFEASYYPNIVIDDRVKAAELALLRKVAFESKAQLEHDFEFYERRYSPRSAEERVADAKDAPLPAELQYHQPRPDAPMSRFKLAFQDLSKSAVPKNKTTGRMRVPDRTVIRTRKGE